jgi:hypothetical protein
MLIIKNPGYPPPNNAMSPRALAGITEIIIHHTAGPAHQTALEIDTEHRNQGWAMIGYNFVIDFDGTIFSGRPMEYVPAAAYGRNATSVDVVLTGNFELGDPGYTGEPTVPQIAALEALGIYLHQRLPSITRTIGHRDVARLFYPNDTAPYATACPGSELYKQIPAIKAAITAAMPRT